MFSVFTDRCVDSRKYAKNEGKKQANCPISQHKTQEKHPFLDAHSNSKNT